MKEGSPRDPRGPGGDQEPGLPQAPAERHQARPLPAESLHPETALLTSQRREQGRPCHVLDSVHILQHDCYLHRLIGDLLDDVMAVGVRAAALGLGLGPLVPPLPAARSLSPLVLQTTSV